jgi:hypothetical protein
LPSFDGGEHQFDTWQMAVAERLLRDLAVRVGPIAHAGERVLPVGGELGRLLPDGGLRRGTTVGVTGSTSLSLALLAEASAAGSWIAAVGVPNLGVCAAAEAGIDVSRLVLIPRAERWAEVVAALVDGFDVVLTYGNRQMRRVAARVRERDAVLVVLDPAPAIPVDLHLEVARRRWAGIGQGHGHLDACEVTVDVRGRGAASRGKRQLVHMGAA